MTEHSLDLDNLLGLAGWVRVPILDQAHICVPPGIAIYDQTRAAELYGLLGFAEPHVVLMAMPKNDALPAPLNDHWLMTVAFHPVGPIVRNDLKPKERALILDKLVERAKRDNERRQREGFPPYEIARYLKEPLPSVTGASGSLLKAHWSVVITLDHGGRSHHCQNWLNAVGTSEGVIVTRFLAHPMAMLDLEKMVRKISYNLHVNADKAQAPLPRAKGSGAARKGTDIILEMVPLVSVVL